jgi:2-polyprenyl-6-methoxyphenol hydroxylase-like FAD-dependent oxidoreductase
VHAAIDAGADVRHHTRLIDLVMDGDRVRGVRLATPDGRRREVRAPLVVGADGVRSAVARRVGAAVSRSGRHISATTYGYWSDLATDGYEWTFRPDACSGVIPTNDGRACVFASASVERIGQGGIDVIHEIVAEGSPDVAERVRAATPPAGTRTWTGHHGYLRRAWGPGWALVGDAGYYKDPISAHGLTDALRDAELLARAVAEWHRGDRPHGEAFERYEATRDRLSIPLFDVVDRIASHAWDTAQIGDLLLQLSSTMSEENETLAALDGDPVR